MLHLFAGLLAYGPLSPGRQGATGSGTTYTWSHNWAAVAGIILCVFLLAVWFEGWTPFDEDESDTDDPS